MPDWNETPADTEKNADKFEYSAGGTNNAVKKTPPDVSIQQTPKTSTSTKWVKINRIIRKLHPPTPNNVNTRTNSKTIQNKYYCIPQPELKNA